MIDLNYVATTPADLFHIPPCRSTELTDQFLQIASKYMDDLKADIGNAADGEEIVFKYFPMVAEYAVLAKNDNELLFAIYCASGAVIKLDEFANQLLKSEVISQFFK